MLLAPCALTVWRPLRSVMKAGPAKRRRRTTWSAQVGRPNPQVFRTFCRHDSSSRSRSIAASSARTDLLILAVWGFGNPLGDGDEPFVDLSALIRWQ
jgi:hypothetical protein